MNLDGLLRTAETELKSLGKVTLHELPYRAQMLIHQSQLNDDGLTGAITVKYALGLEGTPEEIADKITLELVMEVNEALVECGLVRIPGEEGDLEKNLESTPQGVSVSH